MEVDLLYNEFSFLVLLTRFVRLRVRPPNHSLAAFTKNIAHTVKASDEQSILGRTYSYIYTLVKEVGPSFWKNKRQNKTI